MRIGLTRGTHYYPNDSSWSPRQIQPCSVRRNMKAGTDIELPKHSILKGSNVKQPETTFDAKISFPFSARQRGQRRSFQMQQSRRREACSWVGFVELLQQKFTWRNECRDTMPLEKMATMRVTEQWILGSAGANSDEPMGFASLTISDDATAALI